MVSAKLYRKELRLLRQVRFVPRKCICGVLTTAATCICTLLTASYHTARYQTYGQYLGLRNEFHVGRKHVHVLSEVLRSHCL